MIKSPILFLAASLFAAAYSPAGAADKLILAVSQKGQWDTSMPALGVEKGFFKEEGIEVELFYTNGTAETQQAVLSGSVDIGVAVGFLGLLPAYAKGAPVRVIASEWTGANDFFWYVKADSPIKDMRDATHKTIGFSTNGSSSNLVLLELLKQTGVKAQPVPTGGTAATMTQVLSGQIDIGWSQAPLGLQDVAAGKLRIVARGSDVKSVAEQTTRVTISTAERLATKREVMKRFMRAYQRTLDWAYSGPAAADSFAAAIKVSPALMRATVEQHYPKSAMRLDEVRGLEQTMRQAVELKRLAAPLKQDQIAELIRIIHGK